MQEEETERVRQEGLIFQGTLAHKKEERIEKRLRRAKGEDKEC